MSGLRGAARGALCQLQQRSRRPTSGLGALAAPREACQIVDEDRRRVGKGDEIDIACRLAARAFELEPRITAVESWIDDRRRINSLAVGPQALVPDMTKQPVS